MEKIKICIDAGHGGKDPGAVLGNRYEKDDTLAFAKRLGKVLTANGFDVCYTRTDDVYNSPSEKAAQANAANPDLFISVHRNAASNPSATGTEVFVYNKSGKKYEIAQAICKGWERHGFTDRGVKLGNSLTVLSKTKMPALLLEVGFITTKADNALYDAKFCNLVNVVTKAVCDAYGMPFKTLTQLAAIK